MSDIIDDFIISELDKCVGGLYIIDEESCVILWINEYIKKRYGDVCGKHCYEVFNSNVRRCGFCPENINLGTTYSWDYYDSAKDKWIKIKSRIVTHRESQKKYRLHSVNSVNDIMQLNREAITQMAFLQNLLRENEKMKALLEWDAGHDKMTGLYNRGQYLKDAENFFCGCDNVGIIYYDINGLKKVNDTLGHKAGDILILKLSSSLEAVSGENIRCYRLGGDEFVAVTIGIDFDRIKEITDSIQNNICIQNEKEPVPLCSVSFGIAFCESKCTPDDLLRAADNEMYRAKRALYK